MVKLVMLPKDTRFVQPAMEPVEEEVTHTMVYDDCSQQSHQARTVRESQVNQSRAKAQTPTYDRCDCSANNTCRKKHEKSDEIHLEV
jgi:hypothetical protein